MTSPITRTRRIMRRCNCRAITRREMNAPTARVVSRFRRDVHSAAGPISRENLARRTARRDIEEPDWSIGQVAPRGQPRGTGCTWLISLYAYTWYVGYTKGSFPLSWRISWQEIICYTTNFKLHVLYYRSLATDSEINIPKPKGIRFIAIALLHV